MSQGRYFPIWQLTQSRVREFIREPAAVFWVYVFPLLLALSLGIAFRDKPVRRVNVDLVETAQNSESIKALQDVLEKDPRLDIRRQPPDAWERRLQRGKSDVTVEQADSESGHPGYQLWHDPNRPESELARAVVEAALLRLAAGDRAPAFTERQPEQRGMRYIDFLIPGLLGMNIMGGGLWGVGFVIVDMRVRKLLKRFLATPMRRRDFMLGVMLSRLLFTVPEVLMLLTFGYIAFDVGNRGSFLELLAVILIGAASFAGLGLLVACRSKTIETAAGLMNLVMLPMWVVSGVFFPSNRFPESAQPIIDALPLTALNDALRGVMLDGKSLFQLGPQLGVLVAWGLVCFAISLRFFRWR